LSPFALPEADTTFRGEIADTQCALEVHSLRRSHQEMIAMEPSVKTNVEFARFIDNKKSAIVFHYKTDGKKSTDTYTPDGKKRVSLNMSSGQLTSSASWHDSVLVIESTLDIKVPSATVVVTGLKPVIDTWTLAADGRTLTHDAADHKEIYVYEKQ
jgi:hypothetical protein